MAVTKMKRFRVMTLREDSDSLIRLMQDLGCVDVGKEYAEEPPDGAGTFDASAEDAEVKTRIAETGAALTFLAGYVSKPKGLFTPPREGCEVRKHPPRTTARQRYNIFYVYDA